MLKAIYRMWLTLRLLARRASYQLHREEFYRLAEQLSKDRSAIARLENERNALDGRHLPTVHQLGR